MSENEIGAIIIDTAAGIYRIINGELDNK